MMKNSTALLTADAPPDRSRMGGKGAALVSLTQAGFNVPAFVIVPAGPRERQRGDTERQVEETLQGFVRPVLEELGSDGSQQWAVRSSAVDEDGAQHAFAGQLDSYLNVAIDDVPHRVKAVQRSGHGERASAYRAEHGLPSDAITPAVVVQQMLSPSSAGVAFSADPISGRRGVSVVSAVPGLGEQLVAGDVDGHTWWIDRRGHVERSTSPGSDSPSQPEQDQPPLTQEQAIEVARLAQRCAEHFQCPQDIEWAFEGEQLFLLQARPITGLAGRSDPDATLNIWDNSNIAESYNGVTSALTFSFARYAYEHVYREFCRILHVPMRTVKANDQVFAHMLGRIRGRVYYNLLNWYRLLTMLPGFRANRGFMEQMMGVDESLPNSVAESLVTSTWSQRLLDRVHLMRSATALVWHHFWLPRTIQRFYGRLNAVLAEPNPPIATRRLDELAVDYRTLEASLLRSWDAPLVNDFLAMIFFGLLGKLARSWCGDEHGSLQNDLLVGEGGIISTEPARRMAAMGTMAASDAGLVRSLQRDPVHRIRGSLEQHPKLQAAIHDYLREFGDRCLEELKLESATLNDDPTSLFRSVGAVAASESAQANRIDQETATSNSSPHPMRANAEARVADSLRGRPVRRLVFAWVLKNARGRVRDRENLRFERTRVFGRVRQIFVEIGRRLHADRALDDPRDVFHLELREVLAFIDGDPGCTDLAGLAEVRRREDKQLRLEPHPPARITTHGPPGLIDDVTSTHADRTEAADHPSSDSSTSLAGIGCCPGVVRGRARVIRDPRGVQLEAGDILVAERTDPGWILLFPAAAGVVVERGSLLSHSAIVARELGLPAIVSVPNLMSTIQDGEIIEIDGRQGTIQQIGDQETQSAVNTSEMR